MPLDGNMMKIPLPQALWLQREEGECTNVKVVAEEGEVLAHRAVLAFAHRSVGQALIEAQEDDEIVVIAKEFSLCDVLTDLEQLYFRAADDKLDLAVFSQFGDPKLIVEESSPVLVDFSNLNMPAISTLLDDNGLIASGESSSSEMIRLSAIKGKKRAAPMVDIPSAMIPSKLVKIEFGQLENDEADVKPAVTETCPKCHHCHRRFDYASDRDEHQRNCLRQLYKNSSKQGDVNPLDVQGDAFDCLYCSEVTKSVVLLKNHIKLAHMRVTEMGMLSCEICGTTIKKGGSHIYIHIRSEYHRYKCDYCDCRFYSRTKQVEHERVAHTRKAELKCKFCDQMFMLSATRAEHHRSCNKNPDRRSPKKYKSYHSSPVAAATAAVENSIKRSQQQFDTSALDSSAFFTGAVPKDKTKVFTQTIGGSVNDQIMALLGKK